MIINCLVVDDEPIARDGIMEHIAQVDFLYPIATCKNAVEASMELRKNQVDLVFLDIQMPKITGIDFLKNLQNPPQVIITTAFPEYAIEGYELNILDYLLKPISFERFFKAALKAQNHFSLQAINQTSSNQAYFFIKANQKIEKIYMDDVLYIEALSNHIIIYTRENKYIAYMSFKGIESQLPKNRFLKIHKSFIVSVDAIKTIDNDEIILENKTLPISKSYKTLVTERIEKDLFRR